MVGDAVVEAEVDLGVEEGVLVEEDTVSVGSIPWFATDVRCMAIWPMPIPALVAHQQAVAILASLEEVRRDLGS